MLAMEPAAMPAPCSAMRQGARLPLVLESRSYCGVAVPPTTEAWALVGESSSVNVFRCTDGWAGGRSGGQEEVTSTTLAH